MNPLFDPTLILIIVLFTLSLTFKFYNKEVIALITLFAAGLILRYWAVQLDPFLHEWDERYHALVARNMMDNPFVPTLRKMPILPYDYRWWCCNNIWLHKQPLFLWQIALSMKVFGVSEFAVRFPSMLMGALMILVVYRICMLALGDKNVAYLSALLLSVSNFQFKLISGVVGMDHNDMAFSFYILLSIWALFEYYKSGKLKWAIWVGVFAGCAILNKWLVGLLVYTSWLIFIFSSQVVKKDKELKLSHLLLSVLVCMIVFLPWQIYTLLRFPVEASYELIYNSRHLFEVVESKSGDVLYYIINSNFYYGNYTWILLIAGICASLYLYRRNRYVMSLLIYLFVAYIFFSVIAQTKLVSYISIIAPVVFIVISIGINALLNLINRNKYVYQLVSIFLLITVLDINRFAIAFCKDDWHKRKLHNTSIYKRVHSQIPSDIKYVFNLPEFEDVEFMFYNNNLTAHHFCPSYEDFTIISKRKLKIAVFKEHYGYGIPDYVSKYPYTYIINEDLY
ncbi:MAG: glycosyltransferase family 39 protein [Bacteroidetes bacterium]|nr:glycosyltransferase family 39 protein [Bacteroidota bacterium]